MKKRFFDFLRETCSATTCKIIAPASALYDEEELEEFGRPWEEVWYCKTCSRKWNVLYKEVEEIWYDRFGNPHLSQPPAPEIQEITWSHLETKV